MNCPKCNTTLYQEHSGVDTLLDDECVCREYSCQNEECEYYEKEINMFYDFTRTEVDGEEI
jgi:hypothetical protein